MADITDPNAISFVNEKIRPFCEEARALIAKADAINTSWFNGLNLVITNSALDDIVDGRESQGVSRLTGEDVVRVLTAIGTITSVSDSHIEKPTVRSLTSS